MFEKPDAARRKGASRCALLFGCAWLALSACSPARPGDILLVSVDTLRPDHLGIYGYARRTSPNLERWFADAAVFERAYATCASTSPSVVSILTGMLPPEHGVRLFYQLLPDDVKLLPDLLPKAYQSAAFVSNIVLTDEALGIASRFDHYDDLVDERESSRLIYERKASRTTDAALKWLAEQRDPKRPLFLWVHYIDPHGPYRPPAEAPTRFEHEGHVPVALERIHPFQREPGVDDALDYVDRYDEEIAYADVEIGRLLEGFAAHAQLDKALLIFAADHGESMLEHERWFTHGYHVYEEIVRVPLLVRGPGVVPGRHAGVVSLIDIAPTILAFAGVAPAASLAGHPLQRAASIADDRIVFAEGGGGYGLLRAAIQGDRKWIVRVPPKHRSPDVAFSYDLAADPKELAPQRWGASSEAGGARALLALVAADPAPDGIPESFRQGRRLDAPKVAPRADAEAIEKLRALGYVE
jgi:choline-sulfatase